MADLPQLVHVRFVGGSANGIERLFRRLFPETHRLCEGEGNQDADRLYRCFRSMASDICWDRISYCCQLLIPTKNYYSAEVGFGWHQELGTQNTRCLAILSDPVVRVSRQMAADRAAGLTFENYEQWVALKRSSGRRIDADNYQCSTLLTDGWLTAHTHYNVHLYDRMLVNHGNTLIAAPEHEAHLALQRALEFLGFDLPQSEIMEACRQDAMPRFRLSKQEIQLVREHNAWDTKLFEAISEKPRSGLSQLFSTLKPKG